MSTALHLINLQKPANRDRFLIFLLAIATFSLYWPTRNFLFLGYDDADYVYQNRHVVHGLSLDSFRWALNSVVVANWHPLTMLVMLTVSTFFGLNPGAFHLLNALLHTLNVVLLFCFIRSATARSWPAFFIALLWGVHPLRVESVAWISELKDVLCATFWLGCMLAYLRYSRRRSVGRYLIVFALHALALLAKPMAVTLPAILLLLDFWPLSGCSQARSKLRWALLRIAEKLPLVELCLCDAFVAVRTQRGIQNQFTAAFPLSIRIENAVVSYVLYLRDLLLPRHLEIFYPHPVMMGQHISLTATIASGLLLLFITVLAILRLKTQPYLLMGWLWFAGTLIPVIGLVRLGELARADRYSYLPSIGILIAVVFSLADAVRCRPAPRMPVAVIGALSAMAYAVATVIHLPNFRDTHAVFRHALDVQPDNYIALRFEAEYQLNTGDLSGALRDSTEAVNLAPKSYAAHLTHATVLEAAGQLDAAKNEFLIALDLNRYSPEEWIGLGTVFQKQAEQQAAQHDQVKEKSRRENAIRSFTNATLIDEDSIEGRELLAVELARDGQFDRSIDQRRQLVDRWPDYGQGQGDLADALLRKGDLSGAVQHYELAIRNQARNPQWESRLAFMVAANPQVTPSGIKPMLNIARDACDQTQNKNAEALDAYAVCLARLGQFENAVSAAQSALDLAKLTHQDPLARAIQTRLDLYRHLQAYTEPAGR